MTYTPTLNDIGDGKKGISMVDLFNRADIRERYTQGRSKLTMDEIVSRPIRIMSWEIYNEKNIRNEMAEFIRIRYYLDDSEDLKETSTQAVDIKERLKAIPNELIEQEGGILAVVESTKLPSGGKKYTFAGVH